MITSLTNPRIKHTVKLRDRRSREKHGQFILEGYRELRRFVERGLPMAELFICPELYLGCNEPALITMAVERCGAEVIEVSGPVLKKMAYRDRPEGLLGVAPQPVWDLTGIPTVACALYVIAVSIEKPGNLGTILRTADAVGATGVVVCDRCTDMFNPNVVRASLGTLFTVPVANGTSDEVLAWLRERGVTVVATSPDATRIHTEAPFTDSVAVVVGSEQCGLPDRWLAETDLQVRIPMMGKVDSLNAAVATAVILFEAARQRGWPEAQSSTEKD